MSGAMALPNELWYKIAGYLTTSDVRGFSSLKRHLKLKQGQNGGTSSLLAMALTCSYMVEIGQQYLFANIDLLDYGQSQTQNFIRSIQGSPRLAGYVRTLYLFEGRRGVRSNATLKPWLNDTLPQIISSLRNLETLGIKYLHWAALEAATLSAVRPVFEHIKTLSISEARFPNIDANAYFVSLFSRLENYETEETWLKNDGARHETFKGLNCNRSISSTSVSLDVNEPKELESIITWLKDIPSSLSMRRLHITVYEGDCGR